MGESKVQRHFRKGDIVRNTFAGEDNPNRYLMFLKCGTFNSHKTHDCMAHDGRTIHFYQDDGCLVKVGHLHEYGVFIKALATLKGMGETHG